MTPANTLAALALMAVLVGATALSGDDERDAINAQLARQDAQAMQAQADADERAAFELDVRQACAHIHGNRARVLRVAGTGELVCRRVEVVL
ncbi:hypothetical protein [Hydrogenophaga atypica]|uniref:UrcA family protein n=1 Tax=Hydrogenophaga atypica TaxID=249409 RepID=A0ABW2QHK8_9BURK